MEELLQMLESTANLMGGMLFDSTIPDMAKGAMRNRIYEIDALVAKYLKKEEDNE